MSQPGLYRITSIGRPIDPRYPTNRAILIVAAVALVAVAAVEFAGGTAFVDAGLAALQAAVLAIVVWALGREAAPDDDVAAFVAVAIAAGAWAWGIRPDILPAAVVLGGARVVNRTTGLKPRVTDLALVVLAAGWLTWEGHWPVGLAAALGLLLDFRLAPRDLKALPFAAILAGVTVAAWRHTPPVFARPDSVVAWTAVGIAAAFALVIMTHGKVTAPMDTQDSPCLQRRVEGGMAVVLVAAVASVGQGEAAIFAAAALWSVLAGVVLGRPRLWLRK